MQKNDAAGVIMLNKRIQAQKDKAMFPLIQLNWFKII